MKRAKKPSTAQAVGRSGRTGCSAVQLKANGQPAGTFLITIDDGFVEYTYPLRPRSKHWSIHKIYTTIRKAFRVREEQGTIRKPNVKGDRT
jgi:hypothetical protein